MTRTDDFTEAVRDELARRVAGRCSNPQCRAQTSGPRTTPGKSVSIGVSAHITAASKGGPRYDEQLSSEQRKSAENGIWLCQNCAKLVDNDPIYYSVGLLREWKRTAEDLAKREIGVATANEILSRPGTRPDESSVMAALGAYEDELLHRSRYMEYRGLTLAHGLARAVSLPFDETYVQVRLTPFTLVGSPTEGRRQEILAELMSTAAIEEEAQGKLVQEYAKLEAADWSPYRRSAEEGAAIGEVLETRRHVVVLGEPGSGKTVLLRFLLRACALGEAAMRDRLGYSEPVTPILVRVAEFEDARERQANLSLLAFVESEARASGGEPLVYGIRRALLEGTAYVLVDGIDEVPDLKRRARLVQALDEFISTGRRSRFVVTSRPYGYIRLGGDFDVFRIARYGPREIAHHVSAWHLALERREHPEAPDLSAADAKAKASVDEINEDVRLHELASNPLMLTLMVVLRHQGVRLPSRKVELYRHLVDVLFEIWAAWRSGGVVVDDRAVRLTASELAEAFGAVASWSRRERPTGAIHRADLLRQLETVLTERELDDEGRLDSSSYLEAAAARAGLLEERTPGVFGFWHPSFEEYLAASDLATPAARAAERLLPLRDDTRWREVIRFAVAYIGVVRGDRQTASSLLLALVNEQPDPIRESLFHDHLRLAVSCLADDPDVLPSAAAEILGRLWEALSHVPYEPSVSALAQFVRIRPDFRLPAAAVDSAVALIECPNNHVRANVAQLLSNVADKNDRAADLCRTLFEDGHHEVRFWAAIGRARAGDDDYEIWKLLLSFGVSFNGVDSHFARFLRDNPSLVEKGIEPRLGSEYREIRFRAALCLWTAGRRSPEIIEHLADKLDTREFPWGEFVANLMKRVARDDASVWDAVRQRLNHPSEAMRCGAAELLLSVRREEREAKETLIGLLQSVDLSVRWAAATILSKMGEEPELVRTALVSCLASDRLPTRTAALIVLRDGGGDTAEAAEAVLAALNESQAERSASEIQSAAATLLRDGPTRARAIEVLRRRLLDPDGLTRAYVAHALVRAGEWDDEIVEALRSCLTAENPHARTKAAWDLVERGFVADTFETLVRAAAADEDRFSRHITLNWIDSLRKHFEVADSVVSDAVTPMLRDPDRRVRLAAARYLLSVAHCYDLAIDTLLSEIAPGIADRAELWSSLCLRTNASVADVQAFLDAVALRDDEPEELRLARELVYEELWGIFSSEGGRDTELRNRIW